MSHQRVYKSHKRVSLKFRQQGFLIPVALVIVVGLAVLATAMSKLSSQAGSSSFREGISMQSFYAAESGLSYGMNRLFYPVTDRATGDAACIGLNGVSLAFAVTGLNNCSADLSCSVTADVADTTSFYQVVSNGQCGSGELLALRSIEASAYIKN